MLNDSHAAVLVVQEQIASTLSQVREFHFSARAQALLLRDCDQERQILFA